MATKKKAAKKTAAATTIGKTLTVTVPGNANILKLGLGIEKGFKQAGCPTCRSGVDRIVFTDAVVSRRLR